MYHHPRGFPAALFCCKLAVAELPVAGKSCILEIKITSRWSDIRELSRGNDGKSVPVWQNICRLPPVVEMKFWIIWQHYSELFY
jgi:hypothetical protein